MSAICSARQRARSKGINKSRSVVYWKPKVSGIISRRSVYKVTRPKKKRDDGKGGGGEGGGKRGDGECRSKQRTEQQQK